MITHPTVLKIDVDAQRFAATYRRAAAPGAEPAAEPRRRFGTPRALIASLRSVAQRAVHWPRPATPQRQP